MNVAIVSFVYASLFLLPSCTTKKSRPQLGSQITQSYNEPNTYQDHRNQQLHFDTDDGRLAFTDHGRGPAIVLLHGVPTSSWMYRKLIPQLQKRFRVISIDLIGFGSSDKPKKTARNYTHKSQADRVLKLLASRGISNYSLLFHDMGGLVAWEMLESAPSRIENLIVLNTIVDYIGFNQPKLGGKFMVSRITKAYRSGLTSAAIMKVTLGNLGLNGEHKLSEKECYGYVRPMREGANDALYSFFTGLNDDLFKGLKSKQRKWPKYDGRVMVLWGGKDKILTQKQIPLLQRSFAIPKKDIHIYKNNAHFLVEEIPNEIARKIYGFVQ